MIGVLSVQFKPVIGNKEANLQKVYEFIEENSDKKLDLVVLPEFFSTGIDSKAFVEQPEDIDGGDVIEFMCKTAKRFNTNIVSGTVIVQDNGKRYNTCFVINREGKVVATYRKIHLYNYFGGNEGSYTTAGDKTLVVDMDFGKLGISVCFDIKFPMHYRKLIQQGAEIIVSPSAWIALNSLSDKQKEDYITTWRAMNICRATENLVYFVTANQSGVVNNALFAVGNSMICAPMGEVLENAGNEDKAIYHEAGFEIVRNYKKTVPVAQMQ